MRCITIQILIYPCTSHIDNFHFRTWILQVLSSTVLLAHFYYILLPAKSKKNAHTKKVIFLGFHVEKIKKPLWVSLLIINWFWDRISYYLIGSNKHYRDKIWGFGRWKINFCTFFTLTSCFRSLNIVSSLSLAYRSIGKAMYIHVCIQRNYKV